MEHLDPLYTASFGQRTGLSFNNAKLINQAYCQGKYHLSLNKMVHMRHLLLDTLGLQFI